MEPAVWQILVIMRNNCWIIILILQRHMVSVLHWYCRLIKTLLHRISVENLLCNYVHNFPCIDSVTFGVLICLSVRPSVDTVIPEMTHFPTTLLKQRGKAVIFCRRFTVCFKMKDCASGFITFIFPTECIISISTVMHE